MAQFLETIAPEGDWRSFTFTNPLSTALSNGGLYLCRETVGMIFVAEAIDPDTGCRAALEVEGDGEGVLIYHAEKIRVPKTVGSGNVFLPGDSVYWDGVHGNGVVPEWQSGLYHIGKCVEAADADDDDVLIDLKGDSAILQELP